MVGVDTFKKLGQTRTLAETVTALAPFSNDFVQATDGFVRTRMFIPTSDAALVDTIASDMAATPPHVGIGAAGQLYGHDAELRAGLQALQMPIMLINSDFVPIDMETPTRYGITVKLMSGVGHFVMLEDPDMFNRILGNAVRRIVAGATV